MTTTVLERQAPGLLPFTPLMEPPPGMNLERWVKECVDVTRASPVDQQTQADLLYGIYLFGGVVYESEWFDRLIREELMQESKTYQRLVERIDKRAEKRATVRHILALLKRQFRPETVNELTPAIENIDDLQRLEQLLIAASEARNIESFAQMLHE